MYVLLFLFESLLQKKRKGEKFYEAKKYIGTYMLSMHLPARPDINDLPRKTAAN
jgi:hypothetical protein